MSLGAYIPVMSTSEPIDDLYSRSILKLAGSLSRLGRLEAPGGSADAVSRVCGSKVHVDVTTQDGRIADFAHEVEACALGQASASVMAAHAPGSDLADIKALHETMRAMLKEGGPPPTGKWADLAMLQPVKDYPGRHASVLLTFKATQQALEAALGGGS